MARVGHLRPVSIILYGITPIGPLTAGYLPFADYWVLDICRAGNGENRPELALHVFLVKVWNARNQTLGAKLSVAAMAEHVAAQYVNTSRAQPHLRYSCKHSSRARHHPEKLHHKSPHLEKSFSPAAVPAPGRSFHCLRDRWTFSDRP